MLSHRNTYKLPEKFKQHPMKRVLKKLVKFTPIYPALITSIQRREIRKHQIKEMKEWERQGRPVPPPHVVKQHVIREFADKFGTKVLVETGTCHGDMVEAMKNYFSQIYSIELSDELYDKAKRRFAGDAHIQIIYGDSGIELEKVIPILNQSALFWLDGHYSAGPTAKGVKDTPIYEELAHVFNSSQPGHVILIDDARCFEADPTYPSIDELSVFIKENKPEANINVENDIIRITSFRPFG